MKTALKLCALFLIVLTIGCQTDFTSLEKSRQKPPPPPTGACDDYIGGPQDGPTSGCQTTACPGYATITISNLVCLNNDCYFTFRKKNAQPNPITNFPCVCTDCDEICIDEEGTYQFQVDLNPLSQPPGTSPAHEYYFSTYLGDFPGNSNNSVTITWNGNTYVQNHTSPAIEVIPRGNCN